MINTRRLRRSLGIGVPVFLLLFLTIGPFYWIMTASIKSTAEILARVPTLFPTAITFEHYQKLFAGSAFPKYLINSTLVALLTMAFTVVLSSTAAYSLYRLRFRGRDALFRMILVTYAFPGFLLLVPMYGMLTRLKLIDTIWALVVVNVTFAAPFAVWMLQAFFRSVPRELEEAAALDGANRLQTMVKIMLPLTAPGLTSIAIYAFITSWTEYLFASVLILGEAHRTIPVGLAGIIGQYKVDWGLLLAGATVTTLPVLILFALVGRNFVEGLVAGATK